MTISAQCTAYRFGAFTLDLERGALLATDSGVIPLRPKSFALLRLLVENAGRLLSRDTIMEALWPNVFVTDDNVTQCIHDVRDALGTEAQQMLRTLSRRGYLFTSDVVAVPAALASPHHNDIDRRGSSGPQPWIAAERSERTDNVAKTNAVQPPTSEPPRQEIRYCVSGDGARLAFAIAGKGPRLFKTANYLNHLEYDWESPITSHLLRSLAGNFTLARHDARGTGLSDWEAPEVSFEAWVRDLGTIVDAVGWERFPLMGMSQGCAVAIAYAVRHPERVSHLILYGGFARGRMVRAASDADRERVKAVETLIRAGWGEQHPAFRQIFTSQFVPDGTREHFDWFNEQQRRTTSPDCAAQYYRASSGIDIHALLPKVRVPTLVLHLQDDAVIPFDLGREIAAGISDARFVPLQGKNHMPLENDPSAPRILQEIKFFLRT